MTRMKYPLEEMSYEKAEKYAKITVIGLVVFVLACLLFDIWYFIK